MSTAMRGEEIQSLRTENGKVFQTGPQKYRSVTYLDTIHYLDEKTGEYCLIDNRLKQDGENLRNQDNPNFRVTLSPAGISLCNAKGEGLNWWPKGAKPCPPRAEEQKDKEELDQICSAAVYEEIFADTDLRCQISGIHFKDELIFQTPESIKNAVFELSVNGLTLSKSGNDILLTDKADEIIFIIPAPVCTDSAGKAEPVRAYFTMEETGSDT